jgi:hypothetical protein
MLSRKLRSWQGHWTAWWLNVSGREGVKRSKGMKMRVPLLFVLAGAALASGCATYIPPSRRADLSSISSFSMQESFAARPAAGLPASIAAVRIQAPRYRSHHTQREGGVYGGGRYSVMTVKEVEIA